MSLAQITIENIQIILIALRAEREAISGYTLKDTAEILDYDIKIEALEKAIKVLRTRI